MKRALSFWVRGLALLAAYHAQSATVTWDGGGGDFSWQTAANWSGNSLPGTGDDVVINIGGSATVASSGNVTIRSLQCSNNLALSDGVFRVGGGASVVQGQFTTTGFPMLSATGAVTTITVAGSVIADGASFEALSGAKISLPSFHSYVRGFACFSGLWEARGPGSILDFPGLTNFAGGTCAGIDVNALSGGKLQFTNLTTVADGVATFLADGGTSLIDLPALKDSLATFRFVHFEARNGATVWVPALKRGDTLAVTLHAGATLPVAQMERLAGITINGGTVSFPALTNFDDGSFNVNTAVVTVPNLYNYQKGGSCAGDAWVVAGSSSVLNLPALTNITGGSCIGLDIQAWSGGTILLTNVQSIADGNLVCLADGTNSLVDLRKLNQSLATFRTVAFETRNGGIMSVPLLPGGSTVKVTLQSNGVLPVAQMRTLGEIVVNGRAVSFPALTNLDAGSITVQNGGSVSAPTLTTFSQGSSCSGDTWTVTGAGSVLDLPGLITMTGGSCTPLTVQALNGGVVLLANVTALSDGALTFLAQDAGSLIDLHSLVQASGAFRPITFEIRSGGDIEIPLLPGGTNVSVTLSGAGDMPVAQMRVLNHITVGGRAQSFPVLTNLGSGSLVVTNGAVVSAPNLTAYNPGNSCSYAPWTVSGSNSLLELPGLTSLTGGSCVPTVFQALEGGTLRVTNLVSIAEGAVSFLASGTNSLLDLAALQQSFAIARAVSVEASRGGTVKAPSFVGGPTVTVTLRSGGVLPVAQMTRLAGISVSEMVATFSGLTNFNTGVFSVTNGAVVSVPNLSAYIGGGCAAREWLVSGAGSELNLPALGRFTGVPCGTLPLRAVGGGELLLGALTNLSGGNASVISDGTGSLVDLHSLSLFLIQQEEASLTATNNGVILLNDQPFFISGATANLPIAGALTTVSATNATLLFAMPWRSYWVESRNTASPTNPWTFFRRVPQTNYFQTIAPRAGPDVEYRAWEFVTDPSLLDLNHIEPAVQLVLYAATNRTLHVLVATNIITPANQWQTGATLAMTNTFRIFPTELPGAPRRFYRAREQ